MSQHSKIIIKRKTSDPVKRHYGGMWKIAYADFVTAMMCFFLLLWLLNTIPQEKLQGMSDYFTHSDKDSGIGETIHPERRSEGILVDSEFSGLLTEYEKTAFLKFISDVKELPEIKKYSKNIHIDLTNEGLRIQIMDSESRPTFAPGTDMLEPYMNEILINIAKLIKPLSNYISIVGHTASIKDPRSTNVDLWRLSVNRGIKVREFLAGLLQKGQIISVTGKANTEPYNYQDPYAANNIRTSIIILNNNTISKNKKSLPEKLYLR